MRRLQQLLVHPAWWFAFSAAAVCTSAVLLRRNLDLADRPRMFTTVLAIDLTGMVTFLAWLFPVRRNLWPALSLLPIFLLALAIALRVDEPGQLAAALRNSI